MPEDYGHLAEELRAGRPVATPTRGSSMEPLLYEGKTVAVVMPLSGPPCSARYSSRIYFR